MSGRKSLPILVFQHSESVPLGTIEEPLRSEGAELHVYHRGFHDAPAPEVARSFGAIVTLGGGMSANDTVGDRFLAGELQLLKVAVDEEVPILGICLGAQLLARALGSSVRPNPAGPEIGWGQIALAPTARNEPLLKGFNPAETVFHWHRDTFDLPRGARVLASSAKSAVQAFAHGGMKLGLQFHVEVDARRADEWAGDPEAAGDLAAAGTDLAAISEGSLHHAGHQAALARAIGRRFALFACGFPPDQSGRFR